MDVVKFVNEIVLILFVRLLIVVNLEGLVLFDFLCVQFCLDCLMIINCDFGFLELLGILYIVVSFKSLSVVKLGVLWFFEQFGELKSVQCLCLSGNKIWKFFDMIFCLQKLKFVYCDYNVLDNFFDILGCLGLLESLDFIYNKLEKLLVLFGLLINL